MINPLFLKIERINADNAGEYVYFFNNVPHDGILDEFRCFYLEPYEGSLFGLFSPKDMKREKKVIDEVNAGKLDGYLAFEDGGCIGWCNANTKSVCMKRPGYRHFIKSRFKEPTDDLDRIKSIFYFVVDPDPEYRNIAQLLLERVCADAEKDGFLFVEAYPCREPSKDDSRLSGTLDFYVKNGFYVAHTAEDHLVVRKKLR